MAIWRKMPELAVVENGSHGPASPAEVASYIAELAGELARLARSTELDLLAYLLDMAEREASLTAEGGNPG